MRCGYCGHEFDPADGKQGCGGCGGGCRNVHCPRCGYKNPLEPKFIKTIQSLLSGGKER